MKSHPLFGRRLCHFLALRTTIELLAEHVVRRVAGIGTPFSIGTYVHTVDAVVQFTCSLEVSRIVFPVGVGQRSVRSLERLQSLSAGDPQPHAAAEGGAVGALVLLIAARHGQLGPQAGAVVRSCTMVQEDRGGVLQTPAAAAAQGEALVAHTRVSCVV